MQCILEMAHLSCQAWPVLWDSGILHMHGEALILMEFACTAADSSIRIISLSTLQAWR